MTKRKSFTLLELIIIIIILGILVTLAITHYTSYRESVLNREAQANLRLIQAAQKIYKIETSHYYPETGSTNNTTQINANLKLDLPGGDNPTWDYTVDGTDGDSKATRTFNSICRKWSLTISGTGPIKGTCP